MYIYNLHATGNFKQTMVKVNKACRFKLKLFTVQFSVTVLTYLGVLIM